MMTDALDVQWTNGLGETGWSRLDGLTASGISEPTWTTVAPLNESPGACPWCSTPWHATFHGGRCPKVRAIEYYPNGVLKRIEYFDDDYDRVSEITC